MKTIVILMSDTGGGHRAAAEAIRAALLARQPEGLRIEIVDVFKRYSPFPWNYSPELYPVWISRGKLSWRLGYWFSNHGPPTRLMNLGIEAQLNRGLRRMLRELRPDCVVNVHPIMATAALDALGDVWRGQPRPKFITVITDLVSTHRIWYQRRADRTLVPTQPAFDRGLRWGVPADRMRVTGLPVHPDFVVALPSKTEARARLGWEARAPAILVVGGGAGMGPLYAIAEALDALPDHAQIAVVAGRNTPLRERLEARTWAHPAHVYGFVSNMPELMAAADILITKAGSLTIAEAFMAGLPIILSDAIPGQEDGNIRYVIDHGAGLYAPTPAKVAAAVADWLGRGPAFLAERSASARRLAQPEAAWQIADEILAAGGPVEGPVAEAQPTGGSPAAR